MKFGSFSPKTMTRILLIAGLILLGVLSAQWAWDLSAKTEWVSVARDGWKEPVTTHNLPMAVGSGILGLILSGAIWRVFCEYFFVKYSFWKNGSIQTKKNPDSEKRGRDWMKFGSFSPKAMARILLIVGLILLGVLSAQWAWDLSTTTEWVGVARDGWKEPVTTHNLPMAVGSGILGLILSGTIWRVFCEYFFVKYSFWKNDSAAPSSQYS